MTAYTEQQQLTIARAIADRIEHHLGVSGWATESMAPWCCVRKCSRMEPRPITTLADAREQWAASGGDPKKGPTLMDGVTAATSGQAVSWSVSHNWAQGTVVHVDVGMLFSVKFEGSEWSTTGHGPGSAHRLLADIIEAVEGAMPAGEEVTRG